MIAALTGGAPSSKEQQTRVIRCLDDDTVNQLFISTIVPSPGPLSVETTNCVLAGLEVIDPRAVMTSGLEGDPAKAMAGSMIAFTVTLACLNDMEWTETASRLGMVPEDREGARCLMEELGGPKQMGEAMTTGTMSGREGDTDRLSSALTTCGLATMSPEPRPQFATPTPAPSPTSTTGTPAPSPTETTILVITVAEIPDGIPDYDRDEWRHWTDAEGDCQDARHEVLIAESLVPVIYEDDRQYRVEWGRWWAPHLGHHLENPGHIDVEHHVPLNNAHLSGAGLGTRRERNNTPTTWRTRHTWSPSPPGTTGQREPVGRRNGRRRTKAVVPRNTKETGLDLADHRSRTPRDTETHAAGRHTPGRDRIRLFRQDRPPGGAP